MLTNNQAYELSPNELRKYQGFENVSDDEANEVCLQLRELSLILYDIFQLETKKQDKREIMFRKSKTE